MLVRVGWIRFSSDNIYSNVEFMCVDSYHIILYYSACVLYVHVYLYVFLFCFVVIPCIYLYICCVSVHLYVYPYVSVCFSHARLLPHELLLLFSWYT